MSTIVALIGAVVSPWAVSSWRTRPVRFSAYAWAMLWARCGSGSVALIVRFTVFVVTEAATCSTSSFAAMSRSSWEITA